MIDLIPRAGVTPEIVVCSMISDISEKIYTKNWMLPNMYCYSCIMLYISQFYSPIYRIVNIVNNANVALIADIDHGNLYFKNGHYTAHRAVVRSVSRY